MSKLDSINSLSFEETVVYWLIVLTPLWWLLGIQVLIIPLIIFGLLLRNLNFAKLIDHVIPVCSWLWLTMVLVASVSASIALAGSGFPVMQTAATAFTLLKGYFLIAAGIALPAVAKIRLKVLTRAVSWMAAGYVIAILALFLLLFTNVWTEPISPPLASLVPGDRSSLLLKPAAFQEFLGILLPRTSLYMADPPIPGMCGIFCFFIVWGEEDKRLRGLGLLGSLSAVIVSQSRLAWVTFPLALLVALCFRQISIRNVALVGAAFLNGICMFLGITLLDIIQGAFDVFTNARASSSVDRARVVSATLGAWSESPWIGWGVAHDSVQWYIYDIVLGSFSTYAGVLYLQGLIGLFVFVMALLATLFSFWPTAIRGNKLSQQAFASVIALALLVEGLPLTWVAVYFWFFFIWLGGVLEEASEHSFTPSRWAQLPVARLQKARF